jgi:hypothetical protein
MCPYAKPSAPRRAGEDGSRTLEVPERRVRRVRVHLGIRERAPSAGRDDPLAALRQALIDCQRPGVAR